MARSVYVRFEGEVRLYDDDAPEPGDLNHATVAQAVQNLIGLTGATVADVLDYEDDGIEGEHG